MTEQSTPRERALRSLPLPYSLALRLRDAGVAAEVVCEYVGIEQQALDGFYRLAEQKLDGVLRPGGRTDIDGTNAFQRVSGP